MYIYIIYIEQKIGPLAQINKTITIELHPKIEDIDRGRTHKMKIKIKDIETGGGIRTSKVRKSYGKLDHQQNPPRELEQNNCCANSPATAATRSRFL